MSELDKYKEIDDGTYAFSMNFHLERAGVKSFYVNEKSGCYKLYKNKNSQEILPTILYTMNKDNIENGDKCIFLTNVNTTIFDYINGFCNGWENKE